MVALRESRGRRSFGGWGAGGGGWFVFVDTVWRSAGETRGGGGEFNQMLSRRPINDAHEPIMYFGPPESWVCFWSNPTLEHAFGDLTTGAFRNNGWSI